jgi:hypothetical protein
VRSPLTASQNFKSARANISQIRVNNFLLRLAHVAIPARKQSFATSILIMDLPEEYNDGLVDEEGNKLSKR